MGYRENCISVFKSLFPWLSDKYIEEIVDTEINKEDIVTQIFPKRKLTEEEVKEWPGVPTKLND